MRFYPDPEYFTEPAEDMAQWLAQAKALAFDSKQFETERKAAAVALLQQESFVPGAMGDLFHLHHLWLRLEDLDAPQLPVFGEKDACAKQANAVLQQHREAILHNARHSRYPELFLHYERQCSVLIGLMDIESRSRFDRAAAARLFEPLAQQMRLLPADKTHLYIDTESMFPIGFWGYWHSAILAFVVEFDLCELAVQAVDWQRKQLSGSKHAQSCSYYAFHKAEVYFACGNTAEGERQIDLVIARMQSHAPRQHENDFSSWLVCSRRIQDFSIEHAMPFLYAGVAWLAEHEKPKPQAPVQVARKMEIAREHAKLCRTQGHNDEALRWAEQAYLLDDWFEFALDYLDWLVEAGRIDRAVPLALDAMLHHGDSQCRSDWRYRPARLALQQLDSDSDPERRVLWPCMLAWWQISKRKRDWWHDDMPLPPVADCLQRACDIDPDHPLIALITGMQYAFKQQWEQALPLLERGVAEQPEHASPDFVLSLLTARFSVLPVDAALARPFPESHGAAWCYRLHCALVDDLTPSFQEERENADETPLPPLNRWRILLRQHAHHGSSLQTRLRPLARRYGEAGLARFDAFFASGKGNDYICLPVYYALCDKLAIIRKQRKFWRRFW